MPRTKKTTSQNITGVIEPVSQNQNTVANMVKRPSSPVGRPIHQTHGAITNLTGPISNVSQLTNGGRNIARGSAGSFASLPEYSAYIRSLSSWDLHKHAVEDARIVPIDDRERLIRRLETEWTATAARYPGRAAMGAARIPQPKPFTQEQLDKQAALKRQLLKRD